MLITSAKAVQENKNKIQHAQLINTLLRQFKQCSVMLHVVFLIEMMLEHTFTKQNTKRSL